MPFVGCVCVVGGGLVFRVIGEVGSRCQVFWCVVVLAICSPNHRQSTGISRHGPRVELVPSLIDQGRMEFL